MRSPASLIVRNLKFARGERFPVLVDGSTGVPDFEVTLYVLSQLRARNLATSTLRAATRAIMFGFHVLMYMSVDLEDRLRNQRILELGEIDRLVDCFSWTQDQIRTALAMRDSSVQKLRIPKPESVRYSDRRQNLPATIKTATAAIRLMYFRNFLAWKVQTKLFSLSARDPEYSMLRDRLQYLKNTINARMPIGFDRSNLDAPQGLTKQEISLLIEVTDLESQSNPWKSMYARTRNLLIVQILLCLGLRKGEILGIKVDDINFRRNEITIHRRADDVDDPRTIQPNAKTLARILAIDSGLAQGLHHYLVSYSKQDQKVKKRVFLFVARGSGKPLSISALDRIFLDIKKACPGSFERLSPHILRHTWNDRFSELMDERGIDEGKEHQARSQAMGWRPGSKSAYTYTKRHNRAKANSASLELQSRYFLAKD